MYFSYRYDFGNHGRVSRVAATAAHADRPRGPGRCPMQDARGQNFAGAVTRTRTSCNQKHLTTLGYLSRPRPAEMPHQAVAIFPAGPAATAPVARVPSTRSLMAVIRVAKRDPGVAAAMRSASAA